MLCRGAIAHVSTMTLVAAQQDSTDSPARLVEADGMCSYLIDIWVSDSEILCGANALSQLLRSVADAGSAKVLDESAHVFSNGAVTSVLVLSQSHLSIHTWPEFHLANIDLLTYERTGAERMLEQIEAVFSPVRMNVSRLVRPAR